jgi:alpha-galactosidase
MAVLSSGVALLLTGLLAPTAALDNGLGHTPPLGWSSWNYFAGDINESVILGTARAMVSTGLAKVGFQYINIDAGYLESRARDAAGKLVVDKRRFPRGMKYVADEIHKLGLKLGVYTDLGVGSCGRGPGSGGHYTSDAMQMAHEWTADYLKVDFCGKQSRDPAPQYAAFAALRDALNATGRQIYYSICPHTDAPHVGPGEPYNGASIYAPPPVWTREQRHALANSLLVEYTNTFDIWYADPVPSGDGGPMAEPGGMTTDVDSMVQMTQFNYSGPGSWNDADMVQVCTYGEGATRHYPRAFPDGGGMTLNEYEAFYGIWAIFSSPLILSADLRTVEQRHPDCLMLMANPEILAVNQDVFGSARLVRATTNVTGATYEQVNSTAITSQIFTKPLAGGKVALLLFNRGERPTKLSASWADLGLKSSATMSVRDVIKKADSGQAVGTFSATVPSRDANSGGQGGRPAPLASRFHRIPTHFILNLHGV